MVCVLNHRIVNREDGVSIPPAAVSKLVKFRSSSGGRARERR